MDYIIDPSVFNNVFVLPISIADKYLKLCKSEHLKVLIYIMRNTAERPSPEKISEVLEIPVYDVKEAILFWEEAQILSVEKRKDDFGNNKSVKKVLKPQREDVAKRGLEDPRIKYLLTETQMKFGRNLKTNETQTLVWLYDDLGFDVSLILFIVEYAKQCGKTNIRFIESIAADWYDKGIESISEAEEQIRHTALIQEAWAVVSKVFGIERRKPSKKESEFSDKWINEWRISEDLLKQAYDECVDKKSKVSFPYISKILENLNNGGEKVLNNVKNTSRKTVANNVTYDIDLFENMLNSKD